MKIRFTYFLIGITFSLLLNVPLNNPIQGDLLEPPFLPPVAQEQASSSSSSNLIFKGLFIAGTFGLAYYGYYDILNSLGSISQNLQVQSETECELTVGVTKEVLSRISNDTVSIHQTIQERSCEDNIIQRLILEKLDYLSKEVVLKSSSCSSSTEGLLPTDRALNEVIKKGFK